MGLGPLCKQSNVIACYEDTNANSRHNNEFTASNENYNTAKQQNKHLEISFHRCGSSHGARNRLATSQRRQIDRASKNCNNKRQLRQTDSREQRDSKRELEANASHHGVTRKNAEKPDNSRFEHNKHKTNAHGAALRHSNSKTFESQTLLTCLMMSLLSAISHNRRCSASLDATRTGDGDKLHIKRRINKKSETCRRTQSNIISG